MRKRKMKTVTAVIPVKEKKFLTGRFQTVKMDEILKISCCCQHLVFSTSQQLPLIISEVHCDFGSGRNEMEERIRTKETVAIKIESRLPDHHCGIIKQRKIRRLLEFAECVPLHFKDDAAESLYRVISEEENCFLHYCAYLAYEIGSKFLIDFGFGWYKLGEAAFKFHYAESEIYKAWADSFYSQVDSSTIGSAYS